MTATGTHHRRILVATDFSPYADAALKQAVWLARRHGAKVTLAHCLPDLRRAVHSSSFKARMDLLYGEGDLFQREIRRKSDLKLRQIIADLNAGDVAISAETLLGEAFVEIIHAVQQEGYDLVLAGSRGLAAWQQFFVGSTAKRLIRKCPASVWIVKAEHTGPPKVVLAPTDFSEVSRQAALEGAWVARQADADFHVLHVIDSMDIPEEVFENMPECDSLRQEIKRENQQRLADFVTSLGADAGRIQSHLCWGTPWKEIARLAEELNVGLISIGTVGRSVIAGVLLGNTAERVLGTCDCSILTTKPVGFVTPIAEAFWPLHPDSPLNRGGDAAPSA